MSDLQLAFGFKFPDLFDPLKLASLTSAFDGFLEERDPKAAEQLLAYRKAGGELPSLEASKAITDAAPHLSAFVAELFGIEEEREASLSLTTRDKYLFDFKKEVVKKRILKRPADPSTLGDVRADFIAVMKSLDVSEDQLDDEGAVVSAVWPLFQALDRLSKSLLQGGDPPTEDDLAQGTTAANRLEELGIEFEAVDGEEPARTAQLALTSFLAPVERYLHLWYRDHEFIHGHGGKPHPWVSLRMPRKLDPTNLVALRRPDERLPEVAAGPLEHARSRDGFSLTDHRMSPREVLSEIDYCLFCHLRGRDSCSTGLHERDGVTLKKSPSGVELTGCPLEEKISEANMLQEEGDMIGSLALITIDNPMCAGTGHRICNDCMKGCVFQKQDPVNIPEAETHTLTRVLDLPWGLEIYGLLTRWNPLHPTRPHPRPYTGKNVLVVGLGPAGYTLAHHLLCEGFGVAAIDGLKIEPLPEGLVPPPGTAPTPVRDWRDYYEDLAERRMLGFGGVSEYGITVRWDKNFLTVIAATLLRWDTFRAYGGIRFGGTLDLDDAWKLGFDHVAICVGAGKPTFIDIPNGMIRGIRQASDFLMALQLTGAFRKSSLANLQVRLPAVVVGGGLTAIDTGTELAAYYVVQVEKTLTRFEALAAGSSEAEVLATFDKEEQLLLQEALEHGRAVRAERELAAKEGRDPSFRDLIDQWGGVTIAYRRGLKDSPAYRLNHEEVAKALEEGLRFAEFLSPKEALADDEGAVRALVFDRMEVRDHRLTATGETVEMPAATVCVAAGTAPNVTYEREFPGTFKMDERTNAFAPHVMERGEDGTFQPVPDPKGFFTSYEKDGHFVSFYGDNLPAYAGSVVRAMASAKDGYPHVTELFKEEFEKLPTDEASVSARLARWSDQAKMLDEELVAVVHEVRRLTPTITEVVVKAPLAARKFNPGQFYRLQNFEVDAPVIGGVQLATEGLALTGAWMDPEKGLLSTIVLELGVSSRVVATFRPGQRVVLMGPTGMPTEIPKNETVLLAGGGLGNAVLFSIGRALRNNGCRVVYFAGYRTPEDVFRRDDIEASADQVIWACDRGPAIEPRRPQDRTFIGNIVEAMIAFAHGELGEHHVELNKTTRIIAIGSDRMMEAVRRARREVLKPYLPEDHVALGSINSPMQCMMKEICAQCLQRHVDLETGKHFYVFSCFQQDQDLDTVDFGHLAARLRQGSMQEKLSDLYLEHLWSKENIERV